MSLADITKNLSSDPSDHAPIIRHLKEHRTAHGGRDEWSVACICGKLYETTTPKWFIPSRQSCERLYEAHLIDAGVLPQDEVESAQEERDRKFAPGNDELWGPGNWTRCSICPLDGEGNEVYHHVNAHD